jgi:hypothetical protein
MDQTMDRSVSERGPWSTGRALLVALAPLAIGVAIGIATDGKPGLGPISSAALLYWVLLPLAALYPTIAAVALRMAYAPTTILVVASIAPAMVYATRLAIERLPTDRQGHALPLTLSTVIERAGPPALLAVGTFLAIEIAAAAIKRGVAIGFFGAILAAIVLAASFYAGAQLFLVPLT